MISSKIRIRTCLALVFFISACNFGIMFSIGRLPSFGLTGSLSVTLFRLVTLTSLLLVFCFKSPKPITMFHSYRMYRNLALFWVTFSAISLLWTPSKSEGIRTLCDLLVGFSVFFVVVKLESYDPLNIRSMVVAWILVFWLLVPFAAWEILTGESFNQFLNLDDEFISDSIRVKNVFDERGYRFISTFFGNPNTYGHFITYCLPFVLSELLLSKKYWRIALFFTVTLALFLTLKTGSRLSVTTCLLQIILTIYFFSRKWFIFSALAAILIWAIPTVDLTVFGDNNDFRLILDKFSFLADTIRDETFGNDMRFMLFYRGIELIASTLGLGVGIGGISSAMLENSEYYSTDVYVDGRIVGTITDFHNVFLEIAVQYGIIVFLAFVTFLGSLFNFFFKIFSRPIWESSYQVKVYSFLGILCILNIIFTSAISSSVLRTGSFYIFLSSISVIAMSLEFLANHDREYHQSIFSPVPAITFAKN